jgi:hypothetical protein
LRIVGIGASAGGFAAVTTALGALPDAFPAAVLVVIHTGPAGIPRRELRTMEAVPQMMAFACPSCGGAISETEEEGQARHACHIAALTSTQPQARLSAALRRSSRRKTRSGPNGSPRRTSRRRM